MDEHGELAFAQTHHFSRDLIEHAVDNLNFKKVIAGSERPALVGAACDRAIADPAGIGAFETATCLGDEQVVVRPIAQIDDVRSPFRHQRGQLALVELIAPALADACGNIPEKLLDQRLDPILDVAPLEARAQADARRS